MERERTNRQTLEAWLDSKGCASPGYEKDHKPVALFDWDNTVIKGDVGDAITYWMINNAKVLQPPGQDWHATSRFMTDDAAAALSAACGTAVPAGQPLPTTTNLACADELASVYTDSVTTTGLDAFTGQNYRRMEPAYAFTAQILAGYTHAEIQGFTLDAITPMLIADLDTTQTVGSGTTVAAWLRVYDQQKDLIAAAQSRGYDVWIISASPQDVVEAFAPMAGVAADHVIGIRQLVDASGKLTYDLEGCGTVADGDDSLISYIEGKRCWVNKVVFGDTDRTAMQRRPDGQRQVFAAGDSDTDIEFLRDATYRFVLNRNKKELMCYAYYDDGGANRWLVNPMFIEPKAQASAPYPCAETACKNVVGVSGPCLDDFNDIIPDQIDAVFP